MEPAWVAGHEGRRNRDINGLLRWDLTPDQVMELEGGFSRQGNMYAGEHRGGAPSAVMQEWAGRGSETRRVYRQNLALTHRGNWGDLGDSRVVFQYENSRTQNCRQSSGGRGAGACNDVNETQFSELESVFVNGELNTPFTLSGLNHMMTSGIEYRKQDLRDNNEALTRPEDRLPDVRDHVDMTNTTWAAYLEDNIALTDTLILTPGIRFDHHSQFGNNWSPSLNAMYELAGGFSLKGGIARTFKAPTPYQTSEFYQSRLGRPCPYLDASGDDLCTVRGNPNLKPEISMNKEIGIAWDSLRGWDSSLTYFRNDYKNRITAEATGAVLNPNGTINLANPIDYTWANTGKAVIHGLEGNLNVPLLGTNGNQLRLLNNFTWMFRNERKDTRQPLSIVPLYTLNTTLDWRPMREFSLQLTSTLYGRRKPRSLNYVGYQMVDDAARIRGSYAIFGLNGSYQFNKNHRLGKVCKTHCAARIPPLGASLRWLLRSIAPLLTAKAALRCIPLAGAGLPQEFCRPSLAFGVSNLFDRQIRRAAANAADDQLDRGETEFIRNGAGALTYNERGRTYFVTYTASF
ncbi:TonB-dependent receptor domain-containing protein [Lampropedia hyalina]|uniref:TonB-dependent receptor domain-containing protein n=1 Tax=Lampropedia hyalina TaxID=198706 RepID=UPI0009355E24|nr:TonB-dependent receptor [Lampropedia hyalina]